LKKEEAVIIHWDEKLLPLLTEKDLVDRRPIIASVNDREQLVSVPRLNTGTGSD